MKKVSIVLAVVFLPWVTKGQLFNYNNDVLNYNEVYINDIVWTEIRTYDVSAIIGAAKQSTWDGLTMSYESNSGNALLFEKYYNPRLDTDSIGGLNTFIIVTPDISFRLDTTTLHVGDSIEKLKKPFPKSYRNHAPDSHEGLGYTEISLQRFNNLGIPFLYDTPLIVYYNLATLKITEISYRPLP